MAHRYLAVLALLLVTTVPQSAEAETLFPSKPLTLVVPYTAGGSADIGARLLTTETGSALGQPVVVEIIGGAGGASGVQKVMRAPADGHTMLFGSLGETLLVPLVNRTIGYTSDALLPVAFTGGTPVVFVTRNAFPADTMDDFIALAKKHPGKFSYGSPGIGTFQHVVGEAVKTRADITMIRIPYRGGAQIMNDVIGGQVDIGITSAVNASGFIKGDRLKAIGVSQRERLSSMPSVQPFGESPVLKAMEFTTWGMVFVPAGTPRDAVEKLGKAINAASMGPANVSARARFGVDLPTILSPEQAAEFLRAEKAKYATIVKGIKFE